MVVNFITENYISITSMKLCYTSDFQRKTGENYVFILVSSLLKQVYVYF